MFPEPHIRRLRAFGVVVFALLAALPQTAPAQEPVVQSQGAETQTAEAPEDTASQQTLTFAIEGDVLWFDTELDLRAGDVISITGSGAMALDNGDEIGPQGAGRGWRDLLRSYPVNSSGQGALIGRVGNNTTSPAFLIGESAEHAVRVDGRLYLGLNKSSPDPLHGAFTAEVTFLNRAPEQVSEAEEYDLPAVTLEMIDRIPRRVVDEEGNEGDNNNFVIVGPEETIVAALESVGWIQVDRTNEETVLNGIMAVLNKDAYLTIPMSELMMFGRVQDYGFAHAEPIAVVAERHHFRLWKAPFEAGGREVWVGAGTHDIGFDRDQRNNGITHKIDPEIDKERDYIGMSLRESGMVADTEYIMPSFPNKEALTATGGFFFSDGRVLVIHLKPQPGEEFTTSDGTQESTRVNPGDRAVTASEAADPGRGRTRSATSSASAPETDPQDNYEPGNYFEGLFPAN